MTTFDQLASSSSSPSWVVDLIPILKDRDIVDVLNALEVLTEAANAQFQTMLASAS